MCDAQQLDAFVARRSTEVGLVSYLCFGAFLRFAFYRPEAAVRADTSTQVGSIALGYQRESGETLHK